VLIALQISGKYNGVLGPMASNAALCPSVSKLQKLSSTGRLMRARPVKWNGLRSENRSPCDRTEVKSGFSD
jgi:hypothetical protein